MIYVYKLFTKNKQSGGSRVVKKELIICLFILALIIIFNIITQNYTKECVAQMNNSLTALKEAGISEEHNSEISKMLDDIQNEWDSYQEKLAYYIEHDELEKVETQIFSMKGFNEIGKYDEIVPELEKCVFILEHIQDKTKLNVKNIF